MIYETNYKRMEKLGFFEMTEQHVKIENGSFMDLTVEKIGNNEISICHYGEQNGDLMRDPEMIVKIYPDLFAVEATYFRNDYIGTEQFVYPTKETVNLRLKKELNKFLETWLNNLRKQGYKFP